MPEANPTTGPATPARGQAASPAPRAARTIVSFGRRADAVPSPRERALGIIQGLGFPVDDAVRIHAAMMDGSSDRPSDDGEGLDPDMLEEMGTLVLPLLDAGVPIGDAITTARVLAASSAGPELARAAVRIRQDAARAFIA